MITCRPLPPDVQHTAFYRLVPLDDPGALADRLRRAAAPLFGSILVAVEGVSGAVAGAPAALDAFEAALAGEPSLTGIACRRSACRTPPFGRLKVQVRAELVAVGVPPVPRRAPTQVAPGAWRALLDRPEVVVIDNRNAFEFRLGRFRRALDPGVGHFRDFPRWVEAHADAWRRTQRPVAMYCTGGIRCEKLGGWMQGLGLEVHELEGGILHYFAQVPDAARDWEGECFVFDNRIALDTRLEETATTAEDVFADAPDDAWRLRRARRLDAAG